MMNSSITLTALKIGTLIYPIAYIKWNKIYILTSGSESYVHGGVLHIRPTLTAARFGHDFLYNGTLDLWPEGCNVNYNGGCIAYKQIFLINSYARLYIRFLFFSVHVSPPALRKAGEDIINPIQSARIRTINSFSFTYGTVEIRAKMPRGDWIWPGTLLQFHIGILNLFSFDFLHKPCG